MVQTQKVTAMGFLCKIQKKPGVLKRCGLKNQMWAVFPKTWRICMFTSYLIFCRYQLKNKSYFNLFYSLEIIFPKSLACLGWQYTFFCILPSVREFAGTVPKCSIRTFLIIFFTLSKSSEHSHNSALIQPLKPVCKFQGKKIKWDEVLCTNVYLFRAQRFLCMNVLNSLK